MVEFFSFLFSNVFLLLISFIAFLFLLDFMKSRKNGSQFPPGPKGIPFLDNILQVDYKNPAETLNKLKKEFGDVYSLQFFWKKMVVLNGFEVMEEALINRSEDIADRPRFPIIEKIGYVGDAKGLLLAPYGSSWKEQRRFTLSTLRDFGMGKKSLEERVTEEAQCLCSAFKSQKDQFDPHFLVNNAVANVICSIAFGDRFDYKDAKFQRLLHLFNEALKAKSELLAQSLVQPGSINDRAGTGGSRDQFDPHFLVNNAVANVICSIAFGDRFDYKDAKFQRLLHLFNEALKAKSELLAQIINEIPVLVKIPWIIDRVMHPEYEIFEFLKEIVSEHKKTLNPNDIRDFIDAYLVEMEKVKDDSSSSINEENLLLTTYDLFGAGTETTSTTLRWALLYMILYPDVQSKVQDEIDQVIGRERTTTMGDVLQMPYTYAVIHEVQRCGDIIPMALPHMTYRDIEIKGYIIPKGTTVITNLSSVLKDQRVWEKPFQFYPKHFLDENGKFVKQEAFMPFSAGRRSCLGERLARMELFLFFTTLLQQITFKIPNDQPRPREDPFYAFTFSPHPYNIRVVPRE